MVFAIFSAAGDAFLVALTALRVAAFSANAALFGWPPKAAFVACVAFPTAVAVGAASGAAPAACAASAFAAMAELLPPATAALAAV